MRESTAAFFDARGQGSCCDDCCPNEVLRRRPLPETLLRRRGDNWRLALAVLLLASRPSTSRSSPFDEHGWRRRSSSSFSQFSCSKIVSRPIGTNCCDAYAIDLRSAVLACTDLLCAAGRVFRDCDLLFFHAQLNFNAYFANNELWLKIDVPLVPRPQTSRPWSFDMR